MYGFRLGLEEILTRFRHGFKASSVWGLGRPRVKGRLSALWFGVLGFPGLGAQAVLRVHGSAGFGWTAFQALGFEGLERFRV